MKNEEIARLQNEAYNRYISVTANAIPPWYKDAKNLADAIDANSDRINSLGQRIIKWTIALLFVNLCSIAAIVSLIFS